MQQIEIYCQLLNFITLEVSNKWVFTWILSSFYKLLPNLFQAVKMYMRHVCKCHGLSGSCALKTCWRKMPPFRSVWARIKEKFDGAIQVEISNDGKALETKSKTIKPPSREDIVYSENAPDSRFCRRNRKWGSLGTKGRICDPKSMEVGGCDLLCCHRGHKSEKVTLKENCKCRFIWCCDVQCETCVQDKTIHRCL